MLDFEEELRKFHPSVEVEDAEEAIFSQDMTDIADALIQVIGKKTEKEDGE
ncbi:MAG: hypothetical protein K6F53_05300 [Lachnospiraceae bacterium]|nr:hypothetical protein [Lachnospiraceae bacterium]